MKTQYVILPSIALGLAAALFLPAQTEAYSTIGGNLSTSFRDVRVFNNFTDATANNNTVPDANFPGWQGANMAIWKASVEWGSRLHGNGNGDPGQVGGLGSGGANFDAVWSGSATSSGGTNDNIHSELAGSSGGVLAFTETPINNGWRIFYYAGWTWQDGPNTNVGSGNNIDLQGVACHEYGHGLGLGHSTATGGPTMFASISGNGNPQRSLETDDINGVKFVYGVALATKPIITSIVVNPGTVTINGSNFGATNNQVWFCPNTATAPAADPVVKALNVNSTGGGTQITVAVPAAAGPGDVFVKLSTSGNGTLSNGWPFDPSAVPPCGPITQFCIAAANSSDPNGAIIGTYGSQSVLTNNLHLTVFGCPPDKLGLFFYGQSTGAAVAFGNGFRCILSPFFRLPTTMSSIFGDVDFALDNTSLPLGGQILPGQTWGFQFWYRDPDAGGANFNASNGVLVPFCP